MSNQSIFKEHKSGSNAVLCLPSHYGISIACGNIVSPYNLYCGDNVSFNVLMSLATNVTQQAFFYVLLTITYLRYAFSVHLDLH